MYREARRKGFFLPNHTQNHPHPAAGTSVKSSLFYSELRFIRPKFFAHNAPQRFFVQRLGFQAFAQFPVDQGLISDPFLFSQLPKSIDYEIIKHDRDTRFTLGFGLELSQVRNVLGSFG